MKIGIPSLSFVFMLALMLGTFSWGNLLNAQSTQDQQQPATQSQPPASDQRRAQQPATDQQSQPDPAPSQQAPASQSQTQSQSDKNTFTGTIVKSGDKYVLQEATTGTTYDIDHQDEVQKFEGKKVKVHGTVDASGKTIHLQ